MTRKSDSGVHFESDSHLCAIVFCQVGGKHLTVDLVSEPVCLLQYLESLFLLFGSFLSLLHPHLSTMQNGDEGPRKTSENEESSQPLSSYIYPVKSLLTGIKPAPPAPSQPSIPRRNSNLVGDVAALQDLLTNQLARTRKKPIAGPDGVSSHPVSSRSHPILNPYPSRTAIAGPSDMSEDHPRNISDPFSPRMQPIDDQSSLPISFTEAALSPTSTQTSISGSASPLAPPELDLFTPSDPSSDTSSADPQSPADKPLKSSPLPDLTQHIMNEKRRASPTHSDNSHISHISRSGIVHLPPLSTASVSSRAGSRGSGSHAHSSNRYFASTNSNASSQRMNQLPEVQEEEGKPNGSSSRSSSDQKSIGLKMQGEFEAAGDFTTERYRHETDENGNHVVIGREGDIRRCEDEVRISRPRPRTPHQLVFFQPIRTPGVIQGFGVMIVVTEDAYAGTLAVRQVSEVPSFTQFPSLLSQTQHHIELS